ncbi:MAG: nuclear transport factor 2 family protein [Bacteroidota bacterium]
MKSLIIFFGLLSIGLAKEPTPGNDLQQINALVHAFVQGADERNVQQMDKVLHPEFRAVVNRLMGSEELSLMTKNLYLDLLKKGSIGGDKRTVYIEAIQIENNNAVVRATFKGEKLVFNTFLQLVKAADGQWSIISDMPHIAKVNSMQ